MDLSIQNQYANLILSPGDFDAAASGGFYLAIGAQGSAVQIESVMDRAFGMPEIVI